MERAPVELDNEQQPHGRYHPIAELGQGGTANVYLAVARGPSDFNKLVVLKVLKNDLADEAEFRQMFLSEARLAARLNHPNVVQTNEILTVSGRPVIVMEYLEGQTLSRLIARSRDPEHGAKGLSLEMHLRAFVDVLSGLHYSHELADYNGRPLNVVHRDMTPQNVFISYDGRVCVLDFGIAKLTGGPQDTQTGVGVIKGKLRYMPPEQLLATSVDRRVDIFAVGVMLWEAAAGEKLWKGLSDGAIMNNVINGRIPSPRTVNPDVPDGLERIVMKALSFDKDNRHATAAELQADLEAYLSSTTQTSRALGKLVVELFGDDRQHMRALIERQLSTLNAQSPSLETMAEWHLPVASHIPRAYTGSVSRLGSQSRSQAQPPRNRAALGVTLIAIVVLVAGALAWHQQRQEHLAAAAEALAQKQQAQLPPPSPKTHAPARHENNGPALPETVQLRVSVLPTSAQLYVDDKPVEGNPYASSFRRGPDAHTIRAEAPGYATATRSITYADNTSIELALEALPSKPSPHRAAKRESAEVKADKPATAPNCDVPFYLDERGIRKIKRECL
jgi:serine/threonine protein kinase